MLSSTPSTSCPSISSLDLDAIPVLNCSLMSESLSLDTLSTVSDDSTPPLLLNCMVPLSKILGTRNSSTLSDEGQRITTTIPTPPRLRTMLKEDFCIERWSETIKNICEAPGHTPWGNLGNCEEIEWIPEGSIQPQDAFQAALAKARNRRDTCSIFHRKYKSVSASHESKKKTRRTTTHGASYRKALVFEREITLDTGGEVKRWSLQVPASSMSPDMVDVMLELRRLNSFFKEEPDELPTVNPPSLMISNSHSVMPLSLPSTTSLQSSSGPTTLAVRRGNKPLPPVLTQSEVPGIMEVYPYPEIPTAFLGTPTCTSKFPDLQNQHSHCKPLGDFADMISTLRSQCATLQSRPSPPAAHINALEVQVESEGALVDEGDEWSFARPLLQKYGDQLPLFDPQLKPKHIAVTEYAETNIGVPDSADIGKSSRLDQHGCSGPLVVPSALTTTIPPFHEADDHATTSFTHASFDASDAVSSMEKQDKNLSLLLESSNEILRRTTPPPPRSPTPSGSTSSPRGILKRCKSVRFAESSLGEDDVTPVTKEVVCRNPARACHSLGAGSQHRQALKRSPLRSTLTSNNNKDRPLNTTGLPISTPDSSIGDISASLTIPSSSLHTSGGQKSPSISREKGVTKSSGSSKACSPSNPTRISTPTVPITVPSTTLTRRLPRAEHAKTEVNATKGFPVISPTPKPKPAASASSPTKSRIEARQTMPSSSLRPRPSITPVREKDQGNKENKPIKPGGRASLSALTYRDRDDSVPRRGSSLGGSDTQATNSRMPVPLRRIFTRFK